ncbi:MAG: CopG family transcriptional regulator [Cyanobacteria bacterium P01_A01_bin.83]
MTRKHSLRVRLTEDEKSRLQYAAQQRGVSMSEIIQDYCKRLPKPPKSNSDGCAGECAVRVSLSHK